MKLEYSYRELIIMLRKRLHKRAEDYAYEEFLEGAKRGKRKTKA